MEYMVNLTSDIYIERSKIVRVEADNIKHAEAKVKKMFPTHTINRICEQNAPAIQYYETVKEIRKDKNEES